MSTVTDIDGNVYTTVIIGTQEWLVENLKTTKLNDGTPISNVTDNEAWAALVTPGYCWNANDIGYKTPYGALYNWYTVNTGKLAPVGWQIPTDDDWTVLTTYLGGESVAGSKLKESGTVHWNAPNTDSTNEVGFTALPCSNRNSGGSFYGVGGLGSWWSSTTSETNKAWCRTMNSFSERAVFRVSSSIKSGCCIRCVRDPNSVPTDSFERKTKYWVKKKLSNGQSYLIWELNKQQLQMLDS